MAGFKFFFNDGFDPYFVLWVVVFHSFLLKTPSDVIIINESVLIFLILFDDINKAFFL